MKLHNFLICGILLITSCNHNSQVNFINEKRTIKEQFLNWQKNEIMIGHFLASDSCNPNWILNHDIHESINDIKIGFPSDSNEYFYSFSDINNDKKLDGLVIFTPNQCDGGNLMEWKQSQVFIISNQGNYIISDTIDFANFSTTKFDSLGFYCIDSIASRMIYGNYYEFTKGDGRCCPSIVKKVKFDYLNRKLVF